MYVADELQYICEKADVQTQRSEVVATGGSPAFILTMAISLFIPKGKEKKQFLREELATASNIQDKKNRTEIEAGLKKILEKCCDGWFYLWDGKQLWDGEYGGNDFIYYCGKDFRLPERGFGERYGLVVLDLHECTIGELRGKKIVKLWHDHSYVPKKQGSGGQSKERFARNREIAINAWYKKIAHKMKELWLKT